MTQLRQSGVCQKPIYVSRRSRSRWDGDAPPKDVVWKPIIENYDLESGDIHFVDGTKLKNVDKVVYCTGYRASFPFWNSKKNGGDLYDYEQNRVIGNYQHTFLTDYPTLALVGMPRVLTFRSFEYQAIAIARLWSGRASHGLPTKAEQRSWLRDRVALTKGVHRRFHEIEWDCGETMEWFRYLFKLAGLPALEGIGRCPPVLDERTRWFIDNVRKYPDHGGHIDPKELEEDGWEVVETGRDSLWFI